VERELMKRRKKTFV